MYGLDPILDQREAVRVESSKALEEVKKIKKTTAIVCILLTIATAVSFYFILNATNITESEKLSNLILLSASYAALLSVALLLLNYIIVRDGYLKSLEPALLLQVYSEGPVTRIHYENKTATPFTDLTMHCVLKFDNKSWDYSYLFRKHMYVGPYDARDRRFDFIEDMKQRVRSA